MQDVIFDRPRNIPGVGAYRTGDEATLDDALAEQMIKQGFAHAKTTRPPKPGKKDEAS